MATEDGRAHIWYADGNGNVAGYTESVGEIAGTIIDAYNEHFGTNIQIWTPETITLQVGDTVPSWNAYEKIEMPSNKIAVKEQGSADIYLICGELSDKKFNVLTNGTSCLEASVNGEVLGYDGPPIDAETFIINILSEYGLEATQVVETVVNYQIGEEIPQWNKYVQYK